MKRKEFLEELTVYLRLERIAEQEIDDIIHELNDHLHVAEVKGQSVEEVIGTNPKEYAKQLAAEMKKESKDIVGIGSMILIFTFWFLIGDKTLRYGFIQLSLFEAILVPSVFVLYLFTTLWVIKKATFERKRKQVILFSLVGFFAFILFFSIYFVNRYIASPLIELSVVTSWVVTAISLLLLIFVIFNISNQEGEKLVGFLLLVMIVLPTIWSMPQVSHLFSGSVGREVVGMLMMVGIYLLITIFIVRQSKKREK
ncbi:MAG TPA: hypothetical protein VLA13_00745 [Massilibacterium sp.]|nr:hypothetical protein [Massilibacterium sp.]